MAFYDEMAALVTELLAPESEDGFGVTTAWVRHTPIASSDPVLGTVTQGTPVDIPCNAVKVDHDERYTPGALIETGDQFWVLDTWPGLEDDLKVADDLHNIIQAWPIKPGDTIIGARIQTRGGSPAPDPTDDQIALDEFGDEIIIVTTNSLDVDGNTVTIT